MQNYDLDQAYKINGPEDAKRLYGEWADNYDNSFAEDCGYIAPREIARLYRMEMDQDESVLDIGAGTGLLGQHLSNLTIDALDICPQMLAKAEQKGIYQQLIEGDLTKELDLSDAIYGGIVSCGTFTHGHVGPECLSELLRIAKPGALFVCGTKPEVLDQLGFGSKLAELVADGRISPVLFHQIDIYEKVHHRHAGDKGLVMVFRKR